MFAQTPQQELERLQQNYIQSFISNDDRMASLVELLSGIQPEMEISDQVVVELHQRYPFNVEKIAGYMETIRETIGLVCQGTCRPGAGTSQAVQG